MKLRRSFPSPDQVFSKNEEPPAARSDRWFFSSYAHSTPQLRRTAYIEGLELRYRTLAFIALVMLQAPFLRSSHILTKSLHCRGL